jgi:hypothetical protein
MHRRTGDVMPSSSPALPLGVGAAATTTPFKFRDLDAEQLGADERETLTFEELIAQAQKPPTTSESNAASGSSTLPQQKSS